MYDDNLPSILRPDSSVVSRKEDLSAYQNRFDHDQAAAKAPIATVWQHSLVSSHGHPLDDCNSKTSAHPGAKTNHLINGSFAPVTNQVCAAVLEHTKASEESFYSSVDALYPNSSISSASPVCYTAVDGACKHSKRNLGRSRATTSTGDDNKPGNTIRYQVLLLKCNPSYNVYQPAITKAATTKAATTKAATTGCQSQGAILQPDGSSLFAESATRG